MKLIILPSIISVSCGTIAQTAEIPDNILLNTSVQTKTAIDTGVKVSTTFVVEQTELMQEQLDNINMMIEYIELVRANEAEISRLANEFISDNPELQELVK